MSDSLKDLNGFTQVWEGSTNNPIDFIPIIKIWVQVPEDLLELKVMPENKLTLWAANEYIDWRHYRETNEFRPANSNNTRSYYHQQGDETTAKFSNLASASAEDYYNK